MKMQDAVDIAIRECVTQALKSTRTREEAAKKLDISQRNLRWHMVRLGIEHRKVYKDHSKVTEGLEINSLNRSNTEIDDFDKGHNMDKC
jgi:hypothetical protein